MEKEYRVIWMEVRRLHKRAIVKAKDKWEAQTKIQLDNNLDEEIIHDNLTEGISIILVEEN